MIRVPAIVIGLFLLVVWIFGLRFHSQTWLTWLDGAGALLAFAIAGAAGRAESAAGRSSMAAVLAIGLFALWIIGLITRADSWLVWCTFAGACASALFAFGGGMRGAVPRPRPA